MMGMYSYITGESCFRYSRCAHTSHACNSEISREIVGNRCWVLLDHFPLAVVPMPSPQFEFKLSNTSVAQLDVKKSSVLGVELGYTKVTLVDKSILWNVHM